MPIGDYCRRDVATATAHESLRDAARRMAETGLGSLVVVRGEEVAGMITDRDVAIETLARGRDAEAVKIGELLVDREPVVVHEDSPLGVAGGMLRRHALRRLPVVDAEERLVGVIASDDLLRLVAGELGTLARVVEAQLPATEVAGDGPEVE